jgi:tetratricopeptide (TPR) repeat protein
MKRIFIFTLVISIPFILSSADTHQESNPFQVYYADPSFSTFEKAYESYSNQLEENAEDNNARLMLSYLYMLEMERMLGQFEARIDSLAPNIKFQYANILLEIGKYDECIKVYEGLNKDFPDWSCPWRHKGEAFFKTSELELAEIALQKAITTRVEHYDAYVMLAEVQEAMGKYTDALATLETGFSYKGKDIEEPEQEITDVDVQFLYLRLLKQNDMQNEYKQLKMKLEKTAPNDERLKDIK